jgi:NTE family protein
MGWRGQCRTSRPSRNSREGWIAHSSWVVAVNIMSLYCGFLHGLYEQKVDLNIAEMVVGTSAGAYAGSTLTSGHFKHFLSVFDFFGQFPGLFAKLAPVTDPTLSQKRAQEINFSVKDGSPSSIRAIGHAALAADNRLNGDGVDRLAWLLTGDSRTDWPVAKM